MVKEIIWTPQAQITFNNVIDYLQNKWTEKEIVKFVESTERVI